ncbi:cystinosin homolog isoform X3 [Lycium barbarum]|uniref:cystinosin homolog isoform X3 n=1 Tax=Lycium barbarum TaxID=112863 RepID=UPI00293E475A|nr:cystinosin homolog isoform X3 [Lycium barbarum]
MCVVRLNFDFVLLNLTKHSSYLTYNGSTFFSSAVQKQYLEKYGLNEMIPVAANDVAFSIHAVLLTAFTLFQIVIYDRGNQKVSRTSIGIVCVAWLTVAVCVFIAFPSHSWLWLISCFKIMPWSFTHEI